MNVKSQIKRFTGRQKESGFIEIAKGETEDIPIHVFLGPELLDISTRESAALDLVVEARAGVKLKKTISANLMLHSRNAWDGQINKLSYFVTPESDSMQVIRHKISEQVPDTLPDYEVKMAFARKTFDCMVDRSIRYQSDPNIPFYQDDRVQFADNTLSLGTGDCDDLVVLYASMLESLGIQTAFVDVRDPEKSMAHVYLMFDTGISPENGNLISNNEKRYVIRERRGKSTIWIPVETTQVHQSFDDAWKQGALEYLNEGVLRDGLVQGWMSIVDVE